MGAPIATIDSSAVSADAARPLVDALAARTEPGAVRLAGHESIWTGLRVVLGLIAALVVVVGFTRLGARVGVSAASPGRKAYVGYPSWLWICLWAFAGPVGELWWERKLPWKPGVYAIGPHVVDARRPRLRFFAVTGVTADVDGERDRKRPCVVRVASTWKSFTVEIAERDVALRVRDQLTGPPGDVLAPLVAPTAAPRAGQAPLVTIAPWVRWPVVTTAVIAAAIGPLAVYLR